MCCGKFNKILVAKGLNLHSECWKQRGVAFNDLSSQKKYMQKDAKVVKN